MSQPKVANSIPEWAQMMEQELGIAGADAKRDDTIFAAQPANWHFSSGSSLTEKEYLLLRVIWNHWGDMSKFQNFMRDKPDLKKGDGTPTPYNGYVSGENDELAKQIYQEIAPSFQGYLDDIRSNEDGTRPGASCSLFLPTRYWQGLVMLRIKQKHTEVEAAAMPSKVWKNGDPVDASSSSSSGDGDGDGDGDGGENAPTALMAGLSILKAPKTPVKQGHRAQPQMETPAVPRSYLAVGGV